MDEAEGGIGKFEKRPVGGKVLLNGANVAFMVPGGTGPSLL